MHVLTTGFWRLVRSLWELLPQQARRSVWAGVGWAVILPARLWQAIPVAVRLTVALAVPLVAVFWLQPWEFPRSDRAELTALIQQAEDALQRGDFEQTIRVANRAIQVSRRVWGQSAGPQYGNLAYLHELLGQAHAYRLEVTRAAYHYHLADHYLARTSVGGGWMTYRLREIAPADPSLAEHR